MYSRRDFGRIALRGLSFSTMMAMAMTKSVLNGVHLGLQTYSFRDFPNQGARDAIIKAMLQIGLTECELFAPHAMPDDIDPMKKLRGFDFGKPMDKATQQKFAEARKEAEAMGREWHLTASLDHFRNIRKKFEAAGIEIYAYNGGRFGSDEEIDRSFEQTKALGAKMITWSGTLSVAKRVAPFADKHRMIVAAHGHADVKDPDQFATPESFTKFMAMSRYFMVNLDLGHFVAANFDPIVFIQEHHARIPLIHLKDRKKNQGPNMPHGQGDTPIKEVLQIIKARKWPIRAYIEYEYHGKESSVAEVKKCFDYAKAALT
jgi:sugar phosphate isomerase/epimerase